MAKDYEDKMEDMLEKEDELSEEIEIDNNEEVDMEHLAGVIKSEMDDAIKLEQNAQSQLSII
jgi:hypothetical protein